MTEITHFSSRFSPAEQIASIKVRDQYVQPTSVVKAVGVTLYSHLTFVPHVNNTRRALSRSFHSLRLLAESENIFRKRILSTFSLPSFYRNWIVVIVCSMEFPLFAEYRGKIKCVLKEDR